MTLKYDSSLYNLVMQILDNEIPVNYQKREYLTFSSDLRILGIKNFFHIVILFKAQKRSYVKDGGVIKHMVCREIERRGHKALVENYLKTKIPAKVLKS